MKIACEQKKQALNLTFSARLIDQGDDQMVSIVTDLQREALKNLRPQSTLRTYLYPRDTLHFSIINLTTFELEIDFASGRKFIEAQFWYGDLGKIAQSTLSQMTEHFKGKEFYIERIYKDDKGQIENSLALNLRCDDDVAKLQKIADQLKENVRKKLKMSIEGFGVKRPNKFFALNLLRFFGTPGSNIEDCDDLYHFVDIKNEEFKQCNKIFKNLKPVFVISDAYLSNPDPVVE